MSDKSQGIAGLLIAAANIVYLIVQPPRGSGPYHSGQIAGVVLMICLFGGFGLYKLFKRP